MADEGSEINRIQASAAGFDMLRGKAGFEAAADRGLLDETTAKTIQDYHLGLPSSRVFTRNAAKRNNAPGQDATDPNASLKALEEPGKGGRASKTN